MMQGRPPRHAAMRKQQRAWEEEYAGINSIPSLATDKPSALVVMFVEYIRSVRRGPTAGRAIDVGAGKGRNAIYLARAGFTVDAVDFCQTAVAGAQQNIMRHGLENKVRMHLAAIDEQWHFPDATFDIAVDCCASNNIETLEGRKCYAQELYRTLKPGGYVLVITVAAEDELDRSLLRRYPGAEKNSMMLPGSGRFQKDYDEAELRSFYDAFTFVKLRKVKKAARKLGKDYIGTYYWMVLSK